MKILATGCLHGDLNQAKKLAEKATEEKVDLVLIAGDFTFGGTHTPGLLKAFKGLNVALIPGNHESPADAEALAKEYDCHFLHGYYKLFGDVAILGCGSMPVITDGLPGLTENELFYMLKRSHDKVKNSKKKIMVTHIHPRGTKIDLLGSMKLGGSIGVRRAIELIKPNLAISSNVHEAEGIEDVIRETKVISVGRKGRIIEI